MLKWLENYWYHYKWHTLIVAFFVIMLTVMGVQMCSRERDDIYIIYAGPEIISDDRRGQISDAFQQMLEVDYDGNGKKTVDFMDLILMNHDELKQAYADGANQYFLNEGTVEQAKETLSVQAMAGDYVIFLIGKEWYKSLHNASAFVTFTELEEMGMKLPSGAKKYDDCSYYLNSLDFSEFFSCFEGFPDDTLVCVRRMTTAASIKGKKKTEKHYNNHIEYYEDILNFVLPEGWKPESES